MALLGATRALVPRMRDRLPMTGQAIRILEYMSWLRRRSLRLALGLSRPLLLGSGFIGLSLPLQDGWMLWRLRVDRLSR